MFQVFRRLGWEARGGTDCHLELFEDEEWNKISRLGDNPSYNMDE